MNYYAVILQIKPGEEKFLLLTSVSEVLKSTKIIWKAQISEIEYNTGRKTLGLSTKVTITDEPK